MEDAEESVVDVARFAIAYQELARAVSRAAPYDDVLPRLLQDHLQLDTTELPTVSMQVEVFDQPNLQKAIEAMQAQGGVETVRTVGLRGQQRMYSNTNLATLTMPGVDLEVGPVDYVERPIDVDETLTCLDYGLLLLRIDADPIVVFVRSSDPRMGGSGLAVDVMSDSRDRSAAILHQLRALMAEHNVFSGKVVALEPAGTMMGNSVVARFLPRPNVSRDDVILPRGVLERVERLTIEFSERAPSLRAGRRHLRRGILMHGPPGTGKTHTVRYLLARMADRTVFVLSGNGLAAITKTVAIARAVQPAMVVLEDVDLVAEERTRPHAGTNRILFELLNQMDGVEEDADMVFVLTTNRPDLLEPALASRPGRVDLAIEIPLPASPERERLLKRYAEGLVTSSIDWPPVVERTEGSSAAFLRELLRQAALDVATADSVAPELTNDSLMSVLAELAMAGQSMTSRLLGAAE